MKEMNKNIGTLIIISFLVGLYVGYIHTSIPQAYNYIINNIDDYNLYLFRKAKLNIDIEGERFQWCIDTYLIDRLNETDWHNHKRQLILKEDDNNKNNYLKLN